MQEGQYESSVPTVTDRVVQASLKAVLEPIFEADFKPCSYGFRPNRRSQDAIAEIHQLSSGRSDYHWILEADIKACFDEIEHTALMGRLRVRIKDKRICGMVKAFLKSGIFTELGDREESLSGTPQGGIFTPPTQQRTFAHVTLRVGGVVVAAAAGWFPDRDAVADGEFVGSDEDVLDDGAQDALAVFGGSGGRAGTEAGEEALEVAGQLEVGVAVGGLRVEGGELVASGRLRGRGGRASGRGARQW